MTTMKWQDSTRSGRNALSMSTKVKNGASTALLECDECGKVVTSRQFNVAPKAFTLRMASMNQGWMRVEVSVPPPSENDTLEAVTGAYYNKSVHRSWDFCGDCGVPEVLCTEITVHNGHKSEDLLVEINGHVIVYRKRPA